MSSSTIDLLDHAINLVRAGDNANALRELSSLLQKDPSNELAWLWLSVCVKTNQQKLFCLEKVLAINPQNKTAADARVQLNSTIQTNHRIEIKPNSPVHSSRLENKEHKPQKYSNLLLISITSGFLILVCICGMVALASLGNTELLDTSACDVASTAQMQTLQDAVSNPNYTVRNGMVIRSKEYNEVYFIAAKIFGPGLESGGEPGVWIMTGGKGEEIMRAVLSLNSSALRYTNYPAPTRGGMVFATMDDIEARQVLNCVK